MKQRVFCVNAQLVVSIILTMFTMSFFSAHSFAQLTGAVFTTDLTCINTNQNIYASKDDVYLNGGPKGGGAGLPDGSYCVRVTDPSGSTILGQSAPGAATVIGGKFIACYQLSAILKTASSGFTDPGYDDTTNPGGEYKVWVSPNCTFVPNNSKTDNFKVVNDDDVCDSSNLTTLSGSKFYDADADGVRGGTESGIQGFKIQVFVGGALVGETTTDANGDWTLSVPKNSFFKICEVLPAANPDGSYWIQTAPDLNLSNERCYIGTATACNITGLDFGNICVHNPAGGYTLGFWSNKNGQALITASDLAELVACNLRNSSGAHYDPASSSSLRSWLLSATATNMAYMLSAQLAATKLNTLHGLSPNTRVLLTPDLASCYNSNIVKISNVIAEANSSLGTNGNTTVPSAVRSYQECRKNILDAINNNQLLFVSPEPCAVTYQ